MGPLEALIMTRDKEKLLGISIIQFSTQKSRRKGQNKMRRKI
jgi:hypothetical protein